MADNPTPVSVAKTTRVLCILCKTMIGVTAAGVAVAIYNIVEFAGSPGDALPFRDWVPSAAILNTLFAIPYAVGMLVVSLGFLQWVIVMVQALRERAIDEMPYRPMVAFFWFFVPIANLWMSYRVVSRIWRASSRGTAMETTQRAPDDDSPYGIDNSQIPAVWWITYMVNSLPIAVLEFLYPQALTADDYLIIVAVCLFMFLSQTLWCLAVIWLTSTTAAAFDLRFGEAAQQAADDPPPA